MGAARARHGSGKALAHVGDSRDRLLVGGLDPAGLDVLAEHVGHHRDLVSEVIEGDEHVRDHQREVGQPELVGIGRSDRGLGVADEVVAEQADGAPGERRPALGHRRGAMALELGRHGAVGVLPLARLTAHAENPGVETNRRPRAHSHERPAPEALSLLGRLEQERGAAAAELEVGRDRGLAVVDEGVAQRHDRVLAGERARVVETRSDSELARGARRDGRAHRRPRSAPAGIELGEGVGQRKVAGGQQHG